MTRKSDFEKLCSSGEVSGPVSAQEIERAQVELGVQFPKEYQDFLGEFGAVLANGVCIYGLPDPETNDPPLWQCVVSVTKTLRDCGQAGTEQAALIPIAEDGTGVYFFLDTQVSPETKIWAIGPGVQKVVSSSFFDFFVELSEAKIIL